MRVVVPPGTDRRSTAPSSRAIATSSAVIAAQPTTGELKTINGVRAPPESARSPHQTEPLADPQTGIPFGRAVQTEAAGSVRCPETGFVSLERTPIQGSRSTAVAKQEIWSDFMIGSCLVTQPVVEILSRLPS